MSNPMSANMSDVGMCAFAASLNPRAQGLPGWNCVTGLPTTDVCVGSTSNWAGVTCKTGKVTTLLLGGLNLVGKIPNEVGYLTELEHLELQGNQINGSIPISVGSLSRLAYLKLAQNSLTGTVPSTFGLMTSLRYLDLGSNSLTGTVPSSLCLLSSLSYLNLAANRLACYKACLSSVATGIFGSGVGACTDGKI